MAAKLYTTPVRRHSPSLMRKALRALTWPGFWLLLKLLNAADHLIDSYNLHRGGYRRHHYGAWRKFGGFKPGTTPREPAPPIYFASRAQALDHMRDAIINQACQEAIRSRGTNFSGRSRNAPCPCGSQRKFKHCCMIPD